MSSKKNPYKSMMENIISSKVKRMKIVMDDEYIDSSFLYEEDDSSPPNDVILPKGRDIAVKQDLATDIEVINKKASTEVGQHVRVRFRKLANTPFFAIFKDMVSDYWDIMGANPNNIIVATDADQTTSTENIRAFIDFLSKNAVAHDSFTHGLPDNLEQLGMNPRDIRILRSFDPFYMVTVYHYMGHSFLIQREEFSNKKVHFYVYAAEGTGTKSLTGGTKQISGSVTEKKYWN